MRQLRLQRSHDSWGALFRPEGDWSVPAGYGPIDAEVRAVRTRVGMIDLSDRAKIELTGSERVSFLDGVVTADLKVLTAGQSAYALLLNEKSRVLGDLRAYAFPDSLVLDVEATQMERVLRILEKARVSDDVEFHDLGSVGHVEVHGALASSVLAQLLGPEIRALPRNGFVTIPNPRSSSAHVARASSIRDLGYAIWSRDSSLSDLWNRLSGAGVVPIGRDAWDALRIEAGVPRFGFDMGEDTMALETAPEDAISFTKGCYVGQEVVARGTYIGQIRRKLVGLVVEGDTPPFPGDAVRRGDRAIGRITSAAWSPTLGWPICLALLRIEEVGPDSTVSVDRAGWDVRARVHELPFVRSNE